MNAYPDGVERLMQETETAKVCTPIIGKFSSGKSALLNTLLGYSRKILKEDIIQKDSHVIPVECKAGNHVKAKSMMVYMEKYDPVYAIRISSRNFGMANGIKSVPLYSMFCI